MCALPSILDPTLAPEGKHTLWLSQFNPVEHWRRAGEAEREACADRMIEIVRALRAQHRRSGDRPLHHLADRPRAGDRQRRRQPVPDRHVDRPEPRVPPGGRACTATARRSKACTCPAAARTPAAASPACPATTRPASCSPGARRRAARATGASGRAPASWPARRRRCASSRPTSRWRPSSRSPAGCSPACGTTTSSTWATSRCRAVEITRIASVAEDGFDAQRFVCHSLAGTYTETGAHMIEGAPTIDALGPGELIRPAKILRLGDVGPRGVVQPEQLIAAAPEIEPGRRADHRHGLGPAVEPAGVRRRRPGVLRPHASVAAGAAVLDPRRRHAGHGVPVVRVGGPRVRTRASCFARCTSATWCFSRRS